MEPGAIAAPSQIWAPSNTVTPSPIKQLSSIVQAWIIDPLSITTLLPITVWIWFGGLSTWTTTLSRTCVFEPIVISATSPMSNINHIHHTS